MKSLVFASRNRREIMRDPMTLAFGVGLPVVLLVLMFLFTWLTGGFKEEDGTAKGKALW